jgi:outer membrane protein assembly factor BamB
MFTTWSLPGASLDNDIRFHNFKLTITKPDGTKEIKDWPVVPDPGGSAWILYTPDQLGTYTLLLEYPGQTYTWSGSYQNDTLLSSSATTTFTVQEEQIKETPGVPLPTEYWTRPINAQNFLWGSISSNWLSDAATADRWQKDGSAPRTPHIMWTKILELGGLTGGTTIPDATYYSGFSYEDRFGRREGGGPIIISGILYYPVSLNHAGSGGGYAAVDLRTGEQIWYRDDILPRKGQLYALDNPDQHGVVAGILWETVGSTWRAYDALTGKGIFNLTGVPSGTEVYTDKGEIVRYVFDYNHRWLALWNNTAALLTTAVLWGIPGWRPLGQTVDASTSDAYSWNVTIPDLPGDSSPSIVGIIPGDLILGSSSNVRLSSNWRVTADPYTMWAISDKPESRGQRLWIKNYPAPPNNLTRMVAHQPIDPVNRVFLMSDREINRRCGYSLDTGELLWNTDVEERAIQYYSARQGFPAYGNLYISGYGGEILAYSTKNGTLLWEYNNTDSGIDTPWGLIPTHVSAVADGVVYAFSGEHSPNTPLYKGYRVRAVDAFTGEELWTLLGWSASGLGTTLAPLGIADGFLVYLNAYDGQIYCVGKGPSATTVTASPKVSVHGSSVLVEGTVIDTAAGTKQNEQAARFPIGVPAVSDESMTDWMEYVYMQQPRPANVTGVEVVLTVLDPNNNYYEVGRTTSDADGFFSCMFTPEVPGKYTIIATFEGSEGYWPSHAATAIGVEEAPAPTPAPTPTPAPMTDTYVLGIGAAAIIAIVVIGLVIILMLRKR